MAVTRWHEALSSFEKVSPSPPESTLWLGLSIPGRDRGWLSLVGELLLDSMRRLFRLADANDLRSRCWVSPGLPLDSTRVCRFWFVT